MADIRIEKKKPIWPWLLLVIILGVIIFLYFYGSTDSDDVEATEFEEVTYTSPQQTFYRNDEEKTNQKELL